MKNILNKTKIILFSSISLFTLCACSQSEKVESNSLVKNNVSSGYNLLDIDKAESTQEIINKNINNIKKLPKHYIGKISSYTYTLDTSQAISYDKKYGNKNIDLKVIENSAYSDQLLKNNTAISVKRNDSNYVNKYAITLPEKFDLNTLVGEPVYLYQVPRVNIFKKDSENQYEINKEDDTLNLSNIICFKDMCSIEHDLYDMH